jgi:hypothetical protein
MPVSSPRCESSTTPAILELILLFIQVLTEHVTKKRSKVENNRLQRTNSNFGRSDGYSVANVGIYSLASLVSSSLRSSDGSVFVAYLVPLVESVEKQ